MAEVLAQRRAAVKPRVVADHQKIFRARFNVFARDIRVNGFVTYQTARRSEGGIKRRRLRSRNKIAEIGGNKHGKHIRKRNVFSHRNKFALVIRLRNLSVGAYRRQRIVFSVFAVENARHERCVSLFCKFFQKRHNVFVAHICRDRRFGPQVYVRLFVCDGIGQFHILFY